MNNDECDADEIEKTTVRLTEAQLAELKRRLADSIARPDAVTPWEVVKARALANARGAGQQ